MDKNIRLATIQDLDRISFIESTCFPIEEAAKRESFEKRLTYYPNHFWLLQLNGEIIGFVNGLVSNNENLSDEMYSDASMHNENGDWQMIFGVNTMPEHRNKGYAELLLKKAIEDSKAQGRKGLVLTCKDKLVHYYAKLGFINEGISSSEHGGVVWYQMRLKF